VNATSTEAAVALYSSAIDTVVPVSSARVAESCKLLENVYRSINIALVNELKMTFDRMGIDVWEVIEAARTKPFGYTPFYRARPRRPLHPPRPFYLSWKAAEHGIWTRFIELAGEIKHLDAALGRPQGDARPQRRRQEPEGLSRARPRPLYKENIDDDRESPSYEIIELLQQLGAQVTTATRISRWRVRPPHDIGLRSVACKAEAFAGYDALVVATAHQPFRDAALYRHVGLVVDTRNIVRGVARRAGARGEGLIAAGRARRLQAPVPARPLAKSPAGPGRRGPPRPGASGASRPRSRRSAPAPHRCDRPPPPRRSAARRPRSRSVPGRRPHPPARRRSSGAVVELPRHPRPQLQAESHWSSERRRADSAVGSSRGACPRLAGNPRLSCLAREGARRT